VKGVFSYERAHNLARLIVLDTVNSSRLIFEEMKHQRNDRITVATLTDTKPTKPA
jgi:hypothetical protein